MKKRFVTIILAGALTVSSAFTALAGWEQQADSTWKYSDNGVYLTGWHWIDGDNNCVAESYYFGSDCVMLSNTITPDNFTVNENGAWTVNGVVQTKVMGNNASTSHDNKTSTPTPETPPTPPSTGGSSTADPNEAMKELFPGWDPDRQLIGGDAPQNEWSGN